MFDEPNQLAAALRRVRDLSEENERLNAQLKHAREKHAELEARYLNLEEQSSLDPRTKEMGILNPSGFEQRKREIQSLLDRENDAIFAIFVIDVDGFKRVNDTLGHPVGDKVITSLAKTLRQSTRPTDMVTIARPGGDEFVIILKINSFDADRIALRAETINFRFRENCAGYIGNTPISLSFGLAIFNKQSEKIWKIIQTYSDDVSKTFVEEMEKLADLCLLEAKRRGKKRICWKDFDGKFKERVFE